MGQITRKLASGNTAVIDPTTRKVVTILRYDDRSEEEQAAEDYEIAARVHDNEVRAAKYGTDANPYYEGECYNCNGSGLFYMGGAVVNGVYTGKTGPCFRCNGTGQVTAADEKRNTFYDNHIRRIHI